MDGTTNRQHGLQADSLGFLVGQRRIERITGNIHQDTQEIVRLLKGMLQDRVLNPPDNQVQGLAAAIAISQRQATIDIVAAIRESSTNTQRLPIATRPTVDVGGSGAAAVGQVDTLPPVSTRPTVDVRSDADLPRNNPPPITDTNTPTPNAPNSTDSTSDDAAGTNAPPSTRTDYVRDARGRFVPRNRAGDADGASGDDATAENTDGRVNNGRRRGADGRFEGNGDSKSWFDKFKTAVSGGVSTGMADTQGVDPTVDAINELGGLLSPMKKAAGFAFKPISMLMKRNKRSEPLPADQERHNREERKFWGRLVDAVRAQGNGNANWAGKLGGLVIAGAMAALRRIPWVAAGILAWETAQAAGGKVNEVLESTETGQGVLNWIGEAGAHVAATFGSDEAQAAIAQNLKVEQEQLAAGGQAAAGVEQRTGRPQRGFTPDKAASIKATAERLGVNPNDLAAIISFETGGTFDPSIRNKPAKGQKATSATGLLQFIAGSGGTPGKYYGMTRDQFGALPFEQQMQYVEKYLKDAGIGGNKTSVADMYNAVLGAPASGYKEGTDAYAKNSKLDVNRNGVIERGEAVNNPTFLQHRKINFFPENAPQPAAPTKIPETSEGIVKLAEGLPAPAAPVPAPADTAPVPVPAPIPASNTQSMIRPAAQVMSLPISASSIRQAPNLPTMQPMPKVKEQVSSPAPQVVTIAQSADTIAQNVGDRAIAHAVTGGLGMRNTWEG